MTALEVDALRARSMDAGECREYARRYLHAAQAVRRKHGRRAAYRASWLEAASFYRRVAHG